MHPIHILYIFVQNATTYPDLKYLLQILPSITWCHIGYSLFLLELFSSILATISSLTLPFPTNEIASRLRYNESKSYSIDYLHIDVAKRFILLYPRAFWIIFRTKVLLYHPYTILDRFWWAFCYPSNYLYYYK